MGEVTSLAAFRAARTPSASPQKRIEALANYMWNKEDFACCGNADLERQDKAMWWELGRLIDGALPVFARFMDDGQAKSFAIDMATWRVSGAFTGDTEMAAYAQNVEDKFTQHFKSPCFEKVLGDVYNPLVDTLRLDKKRRGFQEVILDQSEASELVVERR